MSFGEIILLLVVVCSVFGLIAISLGSRSEEKAKRLADQIEAEHSFASVVDGSSLAISFKNKRILVGGKHLSPRGATFDQILQVDILQDNATLTSTQTGSQISRAVVGGVIAGPLGAAVGALTANTRSIQSMKWLALRIVTEAWNAQVTFWDSRGDTHHLPDRGRDILLRQADEFYGLLLAAQTAGQMGRPDTLKPTSSPDGVCKLPARTTFEWVEELWHNRTNIDELMRGGMSEQQLHEIRTLMVKRSLEHLKAKTS